MDLSKFSLIDKNEARKKLGLGNKKYILFAANPARPEKNFKLAEQAVKKLNRNDTELLVVHSQPFDKMKLYFNAADVLLLTSLHEGSPNVIKEALVCNLPIVSTDVGDVKWLLGDLAGCFLTSFDPVDVADKLKKALEFNSPTNGRQRITELELDSESVAKKIISLYKEILPGK